MSPLSAILLLQTISGAPIYLIAAVIQGIFLHSRGYSAAGAIATALLTIALAVVASVLIWNRFMMGIPIMLWNTVNVPALVASVLVFPVVALLIIAGVAVRRRH